MELVHLQEIVSGLRSLSELEKEHPVLGKQLLKFVNDIRDCCRTAYGRLSTALGKVRALPVKATDAEIDAVCEELNDAPNSKWFKEVSGICDQLAALATNFGDQIERQLEYSSPYGSNQKDSATDPDNPRYRAHPRINTLFSLLQRHEGDLKEDIRSAIREIQVKLGAAKTNGVVEDARTYAVTIQQQIDERVDEISRLSYQIAGTSSSGATIVLTPEQIAENALRGPERVLILNMFFVVIVVALGAAVLQVIPFYQFPLITGFALTTVIVVNAFYLRSTDKLTDKSFLELMRLALLKFFAPLTGKR